MQRTCQQCGTTYETPPSVKPKYCSSACAGAAKRKGEWIACEVCGERVWSHRSRPRRFCSKSCARTAANLTDANPSKHRDLSGENNPMYGKGQSGPENPMYGLRGPLSPRWKGGRKVRKDGYVLVAPPGGGEYALEHRVVMEEILGRPLRGEEVVHHKDGNPSNNAPDNLELFASQADHIRYGHGALADDLDC